MTGHPHPIDRTPSANRRRPHHTERKHTTTDNNFHLAAALHPDAAAPTTRIIALRAAGLVFDAHPDWTFTATDDRTYAIAARVGDDHWDLTIDGRPIAHLSTIDIAIEVLSRHHHDAPTH